MLIMADKRELSMEKPRTPGLLEKPVLDARSPAPASGTTRNHLIMFRLREARFCPGRIRTSRWGFFDGPTLPGFRRLCHRQLLNNAAW
jgi:hypothetical protein